MCIALGGGRHRSLTSWGTEVLKAGVCEGSGRLGEGKYVGSKRHIRGELGREATLPVCRLAQSRALEGHG